MSKQSAKSGYAVLELLISLAILGMLTAAISSSLSQGRRVWEKAELISESGKRQAEFNFILRYLSQAQIVTAPGSDPVSQNAPFTGDYSRITFVSFWRFQSTDHELPARLSLHGDPDNDGNLIIVASPLKDQSNGKSSSLSQETRQLAEISEVSFRYFGKRTDQREAGWHDNWTYQPHLPTLVELTITADGEGGPVTQSTLVRPRLQ